MSGDGLANRPVEASAKIGDMRVAIPDFAPLVRATRLAELRPYVPERRCSTSCRA
jgi:hypothetical protein